MLSSYRSRPPKVLLRSIRLRHLTVSLCLKSPCVGRFVPTAVFSLFLFTLRIGIRQPTEVVCDRLGLGKPTKRNKLSPGFTSHLLWTEIFMYEV
jgi:hypothetical protein